MSDAATDPVIREAVLRVASSSASEPTSDRFRSQVEQELRNAGVELSTQDLQSLMHAVIEGRR